MPIDELVRSGDYFRLILPAAGALLMAIVLIVMINFEDHDR